VKHRVDQNSVKMYDKAHRAAGSVLRVEMTMNNEKAFRVYRAQEGEPEGEKEWRRMRRGLADLHRRGEVSQKVNQRCSDALASVDHSARLHEILGPIEKRKQWKGRPVRALHPFSADDGALLEIISRGEFMIRGICNRDVRERLFSTSAANPTEAKRRSALVSRQLRLLRAHGIVHKIKGRNLYQVSESGRTILTANFEWSYFCREASQFPVRAPQFWIDLAVDLQQFGIARVVGRARLGFARNSTIHSFRRGCHVTEPTGAGRRAHGCPQTGGFQGSRAFDGYATGVGDDLAPQVARGPTPNRDEFPNPHSGVVFDHSRDHGLFQCDSFQQRTIQVGRTVGGSESHQATARIPIPIWRHHSPPVRNS